MRPAWSMLEPNQRWGGRPRPRHTPWSGSSFVRAGRPGGRPRARGPAPLNRRRLRILDGVVTAVRPKSGAARKGVSVRLRPLALFLYSLVLHFLTPGDILYVELRIASL